MVEELADLRRHPPWKAANIEAPVVVAFGSLGADHHKRGMKHAAEVLGCPVVELAHCRHDAPLSHPALFRSEVIDPLLRTRRAALVDLIDVTVRRVRRPLCRTQGTCR